MAVPSNSPRFLFFLGLVIYIVDYFLGETMSQWAFHIYVSLPGVTTNSPIHFFGEPGGRCQRKCAAGQGAMGAMGAMVGSTQGMPLWVVGWFHPQEKVVWPLCCRIQIFQVGKTLCRSVLGTCQASLSRRFSHSFPTALPNMIWFLPSFTKTTLVHPAPQPDAILTQRLKWPPCAMVACLRGFSAEVIDGVI